MSNVIRGSIAAPCLAALVLGVLLTPGPARGQTAMMETGNRVRVTVQYQVSFLRSTRLQKLTGTLDRMDSDSLHLVTEVGRQFAFPRSSVRDVELSQGSHSAAGEGMAFGAVAGALIAGGIAAAMASGTKCPPHSLCSALTLSPGEAFVAGFIGGAGAGALLGLAIGSSTRIERWTSIPEGSRFTLSSAVHLRGGSLTLRF